MSLKDVLLDEMRDLYSAENQLVKAGPKLVKAVSDPGMKESLRNHLEETKGHVQRLRQAFEHLGKKPTGQHCNGMEGLIEEGQEALEKDEEGATKDVVLAGAQARVEHYEIAGYTVAIALAKTLGEREVAGLLQETLNEEVAAAKTVFAASKPLLKQASQEENAQEDEEETKPKSRKEKQSEQESEQDEQQAEPELKKAKRKK